MAAPAIGIDLGTTFSCVAVYRNGRVEVIPNAEGNRITPSYVAFTDTERLVGDAAKSQDALNPTNTIFDSKRLIGRKFNEPSVQDDMKLWPFRVVNEDGKPKIQVKHKGQDKTLFPEELSSIVLSKMKETAESYLGKPVRNAVITVPAYFNDSQRQATKDAGVIAGLNVLRIVNEPTAGALAYGIGDKEEEERNVLIYDLGGGTFDVSILTIEAGVFEVRSTAGNTHLGGEDFDNNMVEHFVKEFNRQHNMDLRTSPKAIRRLRTQCEKAKRILSSSNEANVELDSLYEGIDFQAIITRARFEELIGNLIRSTIESVKKALEDAEMSKSDISDVVLVGGSTRIPMVQRLLQEFFDGKQLNKSVNPDEAVAVGAAIQAANLDGDLSEQINDLVLVDVTPLSLGTDVIGDRMSVIIQRNTTIPTRKTERYYTVGLFQTRVGVEVREGERPMASDNNLLGKFTLEGIPPMLPGQAKIDVTFEIDANGILHASAIETTSGKQMKIIIDKGRLTQEQIQKMLDDAENFKDLDQRRKEAAEARNDLEAYCLKVKSDVEKMRKNGNISTADSRTILEKCEETVQWVASAKQAGVNEIKEKKERLERMYNTIKNLHDTR